MSRVLKGSLVVAAVAVACVAAPFSWETGGGRVAPAQLRSSLVGGVNAPLVEDAATKASWSGYMDGRPVPAGFETPRQTRWLVPSQPG